MAVEKGTKKAIGCEMKRATTELQPKHLHAYLFRGGRRQRLLRQKDSSAPLRQGHVATIARWFRLPQV